MKRIVGFDLNQFWMEWIGVYLCAAVLSQVAYAFPGSFPVSYQSSLIQKLILLIYLAYYCGKRGVCFNRATIEEIKKVRLISLLLLLPLTVMIVVMGSYINSLSMICFQNYVVGSLEQVPGHLLGSLIVFALLPAIVEEIAFRGLILGNISGRYKGIMVSSLLFALMHMNFNQMSYAFCLGLFFAILVKVTGKLEFSIMIHLLFNAYSVILASLPEDSILLQWLSDAKIGGYQLFGTAFVDEQGKVLWTLILIGFLVFCVALVLYGGLLCAIRRLEANVKEQGDRSVVTESDDQGNMREWVPNLKFVLGCLLCVAIALSIEIIHYSS